MCRYALFEIPMGGCQLERIADALGIFHGTILPAEPTTGTLDSHM